jgi:hypothetical protein
VRHDLFENGFDQPWTRVLYGVPEQSDEFVAASRAASWYSLAFG